MIALIACQNVGTTGNPYTCADIQTKIDKSTLGLSHYKRYFESLTHQDAVYSLIEQPSCCVLKTLHGQYVNSVCT